MVGPPDQPVRGFRCVRYEFRTIGGRSFLTHIPVIPQARPLAALQSPESSATSIHSETCSSPQGPGASDRARDYKSQDEYVRNLAFDSYSR